MLFILYMIFSFLPPFLLRRECFCGQILPTSLEHMKTWQIYPWILFWVENTRIATNKEQMAFTEKNTWITRPLNEGQKLSDLCSALSEEKGLLVKLVKWRMVK